MTVTVAGLLVSVTIVDADDTLVCPAESETSASSLDVVVLNRAMRIDTSNISLALLLDDQ